MRTSGVASESQLTIAVFLVALAFLVVLAGGPSQLMLVIERTLEAIVATLVQLYQSMRP